MGRSTYTIGATVPLLHGGIQVTITSKQTTTGTANDIHGIRDCWYEDLNVIEDRIIMTSMQFRKCT